MVVMGRHETYWPSTRVLFYNTKQHAWRIVHSDGPRPPERQTKPPPILGLVNSKVFYLDSKVPVVRCFDLVLGDWLPLDVKGITAQEKSSARCFMEDINSFIYWDFFKGAAVSVLDLEQLKWSEHATKGELPINVSCAPSICSRGSTVFITWCDVADKTALYLLSRWGTRFYWAKPEIGAFRPRYYADVTLTYSSGRLFRFGSDGSIGPNSLDIYSIENEEWYHVAAAKDGSSEYSVRGENPSAASHSTVALSDRLIVFGGFSVVFEKVRILQAR